MEIFLYKKLAKKVCLLLQDFRIIYKINCRMLYAKKYKGNNQNMQ